MKYAVVSTNQPKPHSVVDLFSVEADANEQLAELAAREDVDATNYKVSPVVRDGEVFINTKTSEEYVDETG